MKILGMAIPRLRVALCVNEKTMAISILSIKVEDIKKTAR